MANTLSIIGLVSSLFANINIPSTSFAPPVHRSSTKVRVYAGLSGTVGTSTSGNIPGVALWDSAGAFIGKAMGIYNYVIEDGSFYDLTVKGKKASAEYLSVAAFGKDGLCIAAVAVTSPTGYQAGWLGDVGMKCGAPWYPSNLVIEGSGPQARPACVWIDQDGSNNHPHTGMTMHLPSFTGAGEGLAQEYNDNIDTLCKSLPRFSMWTTRSVHMTLPVYYKDQLQYNDDGSDKDLDKILNPKMMQSQTTAPNDPTGTKLGVADGPSALLGGPIVELGPSKRRRARRSPLQPLHDHLVVSNVTSHSAREVCESRTSAGPDFVGVVEGLFCDMAEKILWPLCDAGIYTDCFDLESKILRSSRQRGAIAAGTDTPDQASRIELKARSLEGEMKMYQHVQVWS
ncbi:hypothetical protein LTR64_001199 [Lithohypha guttulata]|uniref:uncharacterized protein n=1 Tax=Lithohypha guttulata TaxID=1690604 RepID=UPI002DDDFEEF|nr:hypothetical protein LTR51_003393 [Lithohypha guttulata]